MSRTAMETTVNFAVDAHVPWLHTKCIGCCRAVCHVWCDNFQMSADGKQMCLITACDPWKP